MSRSWARVASPSPARSTLMTSAPNHASSCVQVGPDCTCVKSRIFTPSRALPMLSAPVEVANRCASAGLLLRRCGIQAGDAAALGAGRFVDDRVDQRRLAAAYGFVDGGPQ